MASSNAGALPPTFQESKIVDGNLGFRGSEWQRLIVVLVTEQVDFDSCFGVQTRELDCAHLTELCEKLDRFGVQSRELDCAHLTELCEKLDCLELYTTELDNDFRFSLGSELDCNHRFRLSDGDVTGERHLGLGSGE